MNLGSGFVALIPTFQTGKLRQLRHRHWAARPFLLCCSQGSAGGQGGCVGLGALTCHYPPSCRPYPAWAIANGWLTAARGPGEEGFWGACWRQRVGLPGKVLPPPAGGPVLPGAFKPRPQPAARDSEAPWRVEEGSGEPDGWGEPGQLAARAPAQPGRPRALCSSGVRPPSLAVLTLGGAGLLAHGLAQLVREPQLHADEGLAPLLRQLAPRLGPRQHVTHAALRQAQHLQVGGAGQLSAPHRARQIPRTPLCTLPDILTREGP